MNKTKPPAPRVRQINLYTVESDGQPVAQAEAISQAEAVALWVASQQQPTLAARLSTPREARALAHLPLLSRGAAAAPARDQRVPDLFDDAPPVAGHVEDALTMVDPELIATYCPPVEIAQMPIGITPAPGHAATLQALADEAEALYAQVQQPGESSAVVVVEPAPAPAGVDPAGVSGDAERRELLAQMFADRQTGRLARREGVPADQPPKWFDARRAAEWLEGWRGEDRDLNLSKLGYYLGRGAPLDPTKCVIHLGHDRQLLQLAEDMAAHAIADAEKTKHLDAWRRAGEQAFADGQADIPPAGLTFHEDHEWHLGWMAAREAKRAKGESVTRSEAGKGAGKILAKYRNPETGESWSGRDPRPRWLVVAQEAGRALDDFLIDGGAA
jgi:hypothetical protein